MTRTIIALIGFGGGVAVGLLIAQAYARGKATGAVDSALNTFGLGGGRIQGAADSLVPVLTG